MLISFPSPPHAHSLIITKEIWLVKLKLHHTSCNFSVSKAEVRRKCSRAFCELNCAICCIVMKGNTWKLLYCKFPFQEKSRFKVLCGILLSYLVSWWKHEWELQRSQNKHRSLFYTLCTWNVPNTGTWFVHRCDECRSYLYMLHSLPPTKNSAFEKAKFLHYRCSNHAPSFLFLFLKKILPNFMLLTPCQGLVLSFVCFKTNQIQTE